MICPKCDHIKRGCDEECRCCGQCYIETHEEVCNKVCKHADHVDDGGFFKGSETR